MHWISTYRVSQSQGRENDIFALSIRPETPCSGYCNNQGMENDIFALSINSGTPCTVVSLYEESRVHIFTNIHCISTYRVSQS